MTTTQGSNENGDWARPRPTRRGPRRNAGGMYRTEQREDPAAPGKGLSTGGVPLNTANAAVVAAVRLAYEVAESQVERSIRLARRLREAGDQQVGGNSDQLAMDATERLVMKTLMSGLEWWEGSVAEGRCPVKRLAAAEYQMLGTLLGFTPGPPAKKAADRPQAPAADRKPAAAMRGLQVVHKGEKKDRRRVRVEAWEITSTQGLDPEVFFHSADHAGTEPIPARLAVMANGQVRMEIATPPQAPPGRWTCAIWDGAGVQLGHIEVSL